ncbi:MAG TPA: aldo/keto reductase [Verrucomicrobiae bacterium]|nr:aldo/keto reductase [Verrucomicrobiae bacterium]
MLYKTYGQTGKQVSVIGFGGMRFSSPQDIDANAELLLYAHRKGINYFDTAPFYCDDRSEESFGAAIKHFKPGTFYVSSKCGVADGSEFRRSLEHSLQRLGVSKIHFFHIWCLLRPGEWEERVTGGAVGAAFQAKEEGLIEHVVVSSHLEGDHIRELLRAHPIEGVTLGYSAINFTFRQAAVDAAGELGRGVVTMNPLGGGVIPRNAQRFDFLRGPGDRSAVEAALRFNISQPSITVALVGFNNKSEVDEACAAVEDFTPYNAAHVQSVRAKTLQSMDGLCTGCGYCLPCPSGVEIPKMMDAYNQKILGSDGAANAIPDRLKWHWQLTPEDANVCTLCGTCEDQCTQHLPIRDRLEEIAAINAPKS